MNPSSGLVRISCSAFLRIRDESGAVALHRAIKNGRVIMRPLGGSLKAYGRQTLDKLARQFGARSFEDGLHLRFVAPHETIGRLDAWFQTGKGRESVSSRTLTRQLCHDLRVLDRQDCTVLGTSLAYHTLHSGITAQPVPIKNTVYLIEVHDAEVTPAILAKLQRAAGVSGKLHFASPQEIQEHSGPGGNVSSLATTLLRGRPR